MLCLGQEDICFISGTSPISYKKSLIRLNIGVKCLTDSPAIGKLKAQKIYNVFIMFMMSHIKDKEIRHLQRAEIVFSLWC